MNLLAAVLDRTGQFDRLHRVWAASAKAHMPGCHLTTLDLGGGLAQATRDQRRHDINACFIATAEHAAECDQPVAVCDVDLLFLRSIEDVWAYDFDVAVTARASSMPYNTGLWFCRPTNAARRFIARWVELCRHFAHRDGAEVERHGGIDQAALARTLRELADSVEVLELPCVEWNATQSEWAAVDERTRVLHVKGALRKACLGTGPTPPGLGWAVELWQSHE